MTAYQAPVQDMQFVITELADFAGVTRLPSFQDHDIGIDLVEAVLTEAAKLTGDVLAPLNRTGDQHGADLTDQGVKAAPGFAEAYGQFVEGGWNGLSASTDYEGQGLPELIGIAVHEMLNASNMAFALCPLLTAGAIEAIRKHGSAEQQARYLPKMVSGEWTGTMNLTEPQAGSDLSAVRCKAVPEGDHYRLYGQKIYITWGDHDMTDNVIHAVLARTPDAPEGVKGISLFIVPKVLINDDGSLGERNDVHCVSLEHKMGINASPTCVLAYGDNDGAVGYLVGEENMGLVYMFTMMNEARLKVGLQGLAIADRAYQQALAYARDRVQGRPVGVKHGDRVSILHHPDVRRMLMVMKAQNEAMRAVCYCVTADMDIARHHDDESVRRQHLARAELLIPVVKGWCTELGVEIASLGVQVHGGMGFIEETGAAQHLRDARIAPIYEGTNGIQAIDLVGRKLGQDRGQAMKALINDMQQTADQLAEAGPELSGIHAALKVGIEALTETTDYCVSTMADDPNGVLSAAFNYMMLVGYVCGGWQMARAALIARQRLEGEQAAFYQAKLMTAQCYAEQIMPKTAALQVTIKSGGRSVMALADDQF